MTDEQRIKPGVYTHETGGGEWLVLPLQQTIATHTETHERLVLTWCSGSCWAVPHAIFLQAFKWVRNG